MDAVSDARLSSSKVALGWWGLALIAVTGISSSAELRSPITSVGMSDPSPLPRPLRRTIGDLLSNWWRLRLAGDGDPRPGRYAATASGGGCQAACGGVVSPWGGGCQTACGGAPPLTSLASSRYAMAPRDDGSKVIIGCPNDGASESLTLLGTTLRHTRSPKWSLTSSATCSASLVRASYMVRTMVLTSSRELRFPCTRPTFRRSWPRPSSA